MTDEIPPCDSHETIESFRGITQKANIISKEDGRHTNAPKVKPEVSSVQLMAKARYENTKQQRGQITT